MENNLIGLQELEQKFLELVKKNYPKNADKIIDAYKFALNAHAGVKRKSGEPYIVHPLLVAKILIENNMDYFTVMAGLLHDVIEDTNYTEADIAKMFGETVAKLVNGVTKINGTSLREKNLTEEMSIQKLILSMGTDIRVILIKLADRLHNMQTIDFLSRERQIRMANETNELFIPIAERLGIRNIRSELEELTFKCLHKEEYAEIKAEFDRRFKSRETELKQIKDKLNKILKENGIGGTIFAWPEHYYSIYKKIKADGIKKVYGFMLYKIVVEDELDCYKVLGLLHKNFRHLPEQIKDFISSPKPNGYRSLHTVLLSDNGNVTFKVMIRTAEMDKICESGVSSLWSGSDVDKGFSEKIEKYNSMKQITNEENKNLNPAAFINAIKSDLFSSVTWVFTPKLKPICLEADKPTAIDFAYAVHTDIGHRALGANVNGKKASLSTELRAGDIVEIVTSDAPKAPSRNWLSVAKTAIARKSISKYLKDHQTKENISLGKEKLQEELKKNGFNYESLMSLYSKIAEDFNFLCEDEMLASVGMESVTVSQIVSYVINEAQKINFMRSLPVILDSDEEFSSISYPKCCGAVPGDEIVALASKNSLAIHRTCCANAKNASKDSIINATWQTKIPFQFSSVLKVVATDRVGLAADLFALLASEKVNLNRTVVRKVNDQICEFEIGVQVYHLNELDEIREKLAKLGGVKSVSRSYE